MALVEVFTMLSLQGIHGFNFSYEFFGQAIVRLTDLHLLDGDALSRSLIDCFEYDAVGALSHLGN